MHTLVGGSPEQALSVTVSEHADGVFVVALVGELDLVSADELETRLEALIAASNVRLVIDLSGVDFVDSSGLNLFVTTARAAEAHGGRLLLAAPTPNIARVFEVVQIAESVSVEPTVGLALGRIGAEASSPG
jgi:stage II sporulation protein AA (anti-sigma F factor antagonist)